MCVIFIRCDTRTSNNKHEKQNGDRIVTTDSVTSLSPCVYIGRRSVDALLYCRQSSVPLRMARLASCGMATFTRCPNCCLISACSIADSAKPPTRNNSSISEYTHTQSRMYSKRCTCSEKNVGAGGPLIYEYPTTMDMMTVYDASAPHKIVSFIP